MHNRTIIVTGGARGIGYGIAERFAAGGGTRLVIADMNETAVQAAAERLRAEAGAADALGIACDVTDPNSVDAMVKETTERFGGVDVLVNNAGICPFVPVMKLDLATWQRTLDVNLTGPFLCTQAVARHMIEQGTRGRIVFITSLAEELTQPGQADYAASKAGLKMLMASFATALGPHGITCNAVAPGMILTDMTRHHWEQPGPSEQIRKLAPVGRIGTPADIGNAVVFLASVEAEYVSGITLRVDGGFQVLIKG